MAIWATSVVIFSFTRPPSRVPPGAASHCPYVPGGARCFLEFLYAPGRADGRFLHDCQAAVGRVCWRLLVWSG